MSGPLDGYLSRVQQSMTLRHTAAFPEIGGLVVICVTALASYIVLSLWLVPADLPQEWHFRSETGSVTALSGVFLAAGAACAFVFFFIQHSHGDRDRGVWLLVSMALGFLALDEFLMFHERAGEVLEDLETTWLTLPGWIKNWDDAIVFVYGIVALPFLTYLFPTILRYPRLAEVFAVAFFFYLVHTIVDATQDPPTTYSVVLEESAKLLGSACLAFGSFVGTIGVVWNRPR